MMRHSDRVIAMFQMAGGAGGLVVGAISLALVPPGFTIDRARGIEILLSLPFFGLAISAGVLLWKQDRRGIVLSLIVQALQLIEFSAGGLSYEFLTGVSFGPIVSVGSDVNSINMMIHFGGEFACTYAPGQTNFAVGLDLFALAFVMHLFSEWRKQAATTPRDDASPGIPRS